jgi:hypothetical protein
MTAIRSPLARLMPVRIAAKEPKLREWSTIRLGKPVPRRAVSRRSRESSGLPSMTNIASRLPSRRSAT